MRKPRPEDDLTDFVADEDVQRWIGAPLPPDELIELWLRRWERDGVGPFIVELEGSFIGRAGFVVWDTRTWEISSLERAGGHAQVELGWAILSRYWGNGYATEAARAAREWLDAEKLVSLIHPENVRSKRVAEKLGASFCERVEGPRVPAEVWVHP